MELFESDQPAATQGQTALAVEPEPRYKPQTAILPIETNEHGQTWPRIVASVVLALLLIVLIVLFARWLYHRTHHSVTVGPNRPGSSVVISPNSQKPANSAAPASPPSSSNPQPNNKITNTGPGDVVGVFVGSSLAAAGLHFVVNLRRFNKSSV